MGVIYASAPGIIRARTNEIYGTQSHLARGLGISRQALAVRVRSTMGSAYLHEWWEALLGLRPGSLAAGESPKEAFDPILTKGGNPANPFDPIRAAVALQAAVEAWPRVYAGRHSYPSPKRLESIAKRRGPRVKRAAGCEPQGGAQ